MFRVTIFTSTECESKQNQKLLCRVRCGFFASANRRSGSRNQRPAVQGLRTLGLSGSRACGTTSWPSVACDRAKGVSTATATTVDVHLSRARVERAGRVAYGVGAAGMGGLILLSGKLASVFQPVPLWVPLRQWLAYLSGTLLLAGGLALIASKTRRLAAIVLTVNFSVWLLLLNLPNTLARPKVVGNWEGCGLNMTVVAGGWIILALSSRPLAGRAASLLGESSVRLARRLYAVGLPLIALAHFLNARAATEYVPAWLPLRIDWVYLTGAGHLAAGLAILFGVLPELAALLEAGQITAFVILTHVPAVYRAPGDRVQWAMLFYALAIAGAAWLVVATFGDEPPSWLRRPAA